MTPKTPTSPNGPLLLSLCLAGALILKDKCTFCKLFNYPLLFSRFELAEIIMINSGIKDNQDFWYLLLTEVLAESDINAQFANLPLFADMKDTSDIEERTGL